MAPQYSSDVGYALPPGFDDPGAMAVLPQPEDILQPQWDRANYAAAGQAQVSFFNIPIGQNATLITAGVAAAKVKTYRDTSMQSANILPTKSIDIRYLQLQVIPLQHAVAVAATASIGDDKERLYNGGYLEFRVVDKTRLWLPLAVFRNLDPDYMSTTLALVTARGSAGVGYNCLPVDSIVIPANTNFSVVLYFDGTVPLVQTSDLLFTFWGYERRPAQ